MDQTLTSELGSPLGLVMAAGQGRGRSGSRRLLQRLQPAVEFGPADAKVAVRKPETRRGFLRRAPVVERGPRDPQLSADLGDREVASLGGVGYCHDVLLHLGC